MLGSARLDELGQLRCAAAGAHLTRLGALLVGLVGADLIVTAIWFQPASRYWLILGALVAAAAGASRLIDRHSADRIMMAAEPAPPRLSVQVGWVGPVGQCLILGLAVAAVSSVTAWATGSGPIGLLGLAVIQVTGAGFQHLDRARRLRLLEERDRIEVMISARRWSWWPSTECLVRGR